MPLVRSGEANGCLLGERVSSLIAQQAAHVEHGDPRAADRSRHLRPADARGVGRVHLEHAPSDLVFDPTYLGIQRSADFVVIQITMSEGRSVELKRSLYVAIADGLHERLGLRREDVFINLLEVRKENWSFGNGEAQYAV